MDKSLPEDQMTPQVSWQQILAALYDRAPFAVLVSDARRRIITCNPAFENLFGYTRDELFGQSTLMLYSTADEYHRLRSQYRMIVGASDGAAHSAPKEIYYRKKNGELFLASVQGSAIRDDQGNITAMMGLIQNISHQRQMELEFESLFNFSPVYVLQKDANGLIIRVNAHCEELFDRPSSQIVGLDSTTLQPDLHDQVVSEDRQVLETGKPLRGLLHHLETRHRGKVWLQVNKMPFKSPVTGEPSIIVIGMDVTDLKNREADLESKTRDLESFAYMASHDLQEPLRKITMYASILADKSSDEWERNNAISVVTEGARHARSLIADLLAYSRSTNSGLNRVSCDLKAIVETALDDLIPAVEEAGARISSNVESRMLVADINQVKQLVQNLISNAVKYRRQDVQCKVEIRTEAGENGTVDLVVVDNGIGIDGIHLEQIFDPFVRLHSRSEIPGTGIGLAICKAVAERHDWSLTVQSSPGKGTEFRVNIS